VPPPISASPPTRNNRSQVSAAGEKIWVIPRPGRSFALGLQVQFRDGRIVPPLEP
jgi:hypothetical protein